MIDKGYKMKRIRSNSIATGQLLSWKKAEELLPEYSEKQYMDLIEFVQNGGQIPPLVITENNQVIDGYNRWRLANRLNLEEVECDIYNYEDEAEMELHAIVLNAKRRHLNKLQVARAAVRLSSLLKLNKDEQEQEQVNDADNTAEAEPATEKIEQAAKQEDSSEDINALNKKIQTASQKLGVPQALIKQVKKIDETNDDILIHAMEEKQISIKKAAELAELPEEDRVQAIIDECSKSSNETQKHVTALVKSCTSSIKRIQACKKNYNIEGVSEQDITDAKDSINEMMKEAQELLNTMTI
jgi:ParB-like chromosome segregation protein Spo0J